ncbi:hypothetical protein ACFOUV_07215 [Oceanobacillus longus]|uniref:Uncharacterized protein n=1 Tax=Oceanobacillus longus TaxID=930120 RepID=A0ABV8GV97_9BACI
MKAFVKTKKFWIITGGIIGSILLFFIAYVIGESGAEVALEEEKVTHEELTSKMEELEENVTELEGQIADAESTLADTESKVAGEEKTLSERQDEVEEALALVSERDGLVDELTRIENEVGSRQSDLEALDSDILNKQDELASLEGQIIEKSGEPINLLAGEWIVGLDLPAARYQASGSSNFVVYSAGGGLVVNTILGDSSVGDGDYVFFAKDGYRIESSAPATLTPVE